MVNKIIAELIAKGILREIPEEDRAVHISNPLTEISNGISLMDNLESTILAPPFAEAFGGANDDSGTGVAVAGNGDIIIAGKSYSYSANYTEGVLLRVDPHGNLKWAKAFGGSGYDEFYTVALMPNGDIIVGGRSDINSSGGDAWLMRLDPDGNVKWSKTYGLGGQHQFDRVFIDSGGNIIAVGSTIDAWASWTSTIVKVDGDTGNIIWGKKVWTTAVNNAHDVVVQGGNIWVIGKLKRNSNVAWEFFAMALDTDGNLKWAKSYGKGDLSYTNIALAGGLSPDGNYLYVSGNTNYYGNGGVDTWTLKLDSSDGSLVWAKYFGDTGGESISGMVVLNNGDILLVGYTNSWGAGGNDAFLLKLTANGGFGFAKTYGSSGDESLTAITRKGNAIFMVGSTNSVGAGGSEILLIRADTGGNTTLSLFSSSSPWSIPGGTTPNEYDLIEYFGEDFSLINLGASVKDATPNVQNITPTVTVV